MLRFLCRADTMQSSPQYAELKRARTSLAHTSNKYCKGSGIDNATLIPTCCTKLYSRTFQCSKVSPIPPRIRTSSFSLPGSLIPMKLSVEQSPNALPCDSPVLPVG
ncbi:unnamed protein product [Choristocarpus tenellus]